MPKGHPFDIDVMHKLLWERTDRLGRLRVNQAHLAIELGVTKFTMSRTFATLVADKRVRLITNTRQNSGTFIIEEPGEWKELYGASL